MEEEPTQVVTFARNMDVALETRLHCLVPIGSFYMGRHHIIGRSGIHIGRTAPCEIILLDSEVSRSHCSLVITGDELIVTDLNSTNGTFVDGVRIETPTPLPVGAVLRVGRQSLKHEWRTQREILQSDELDRDLEKANSYVQALLPPPRTEGPIRADWVYQPSAKLGGDAFGYASLSDTKFAAYLIDVSGHGAGAALHSVAVMNLLKQRALPNTDMTEPAHVLAMLNAMFPMEDNAGMYFTMWYGVFDTVARRLDFASAGHHPAYLVPVDRREAIPLKTRNGPIGAADPKATYKADYALIPRGASLYLFSDGAFEIVTIDAVQWGLRDFLPHLLEEPSKNLDEAQRLFREVSRVARSDGLEDDFSLVVLTFS